MRLPKNVRDTSQSDLLPPPSPSVGASPNASLRLPDTMHPYTRVCDKTFVAS